MPADPTKLVGNAAPPPDTAFERPRSRLSRRRFLGLLGLTAAGATLSGCHAPAPSPTPRREKVQLVYQDWRTDWFPALAQQLLEEFHATHPNIRVFYVSDPENVEERMLLDMQAGTAPDVFSGCCAHFPIWAQKGYTLDLRPFVSADLDRATIEDWDPAQYRSFFSTDGRQYGLPKYHGALALYYNRDLFDQHRVDYPDATWHLDDYLQAMTRLTGPRDGNGSTDRWGSMFDVSWDRIQVHVNGWGGHFVDPSNPRRSLMAEPEAVSAMEWLRARLWEDKVMATLPDVQMMGTRLAFTARRVAMVEDGSWALKDVLVDADFPIGIARFPAGPRRRVTLATTDGFGIFAGTKHPDAAWELLKFLISKEAGRAMARAHFLQPARASLVDDWVRYIRAEFPQKARDVDIAAFADGHVKGYSVTAEVFPNMAEATSLAYAAWDRIFTLGQAPVSLMRTVSQQIEEAQHRVSPGGAS